MIIRPITIQPAFTEEEIDRSFPFITAAERDPIHEFDILEAARKIAIRHGAFETSDSIATVQVAMSNEFKGLLEHTNHDRAMLRSADEVAKHAGFDSFDSYAHAVHKHGGYDAATLSDDGREVTYTAWYCTEGDWDPSWCDSIRLPCAPEQYDLMVASVCSMRDDQEPIEDEEWEA